ncbi:hypothetical protein [Paucihalobacter sp.]|uniref:hypothetical protein n=1 Tax=Paucihalobacter sp. TaxID=2850405 RepID=UPI002FE1DAA4
MYKNYFPLISKFLITKCVVLLSLMPTTLFAQINFSQSTLNLNGFTTINGATAMEFGPDGRLYVSDY